MSGPGRVTPEDALAELSLRQLARNHLGPFCQQMAPWYRDAKHQRLLDTYLEQVFQYIISEGREGIGRLIVEMPPRYGKSEKISRLFPSWCLGKAPDIRVIQTSYGANLAVDDSRKVREYINSERYAKIFGDEAITANEPVSISEESRSQEHWDLSAPHRGGMVAAGIGGGITGKGAHLLNIDDPIKTRKDADSPAYLKMLMDWYKSTAYTRLQKGGAIIITHTRWSQDDLAGQLIRQMAGNDPLVDQFTVLFLPAIALEADAYPLDEDGQQKQMLNGVWLPIGGDMLGRKPGEALWPEMADEGALNKIHANISDQEWWPVFQQMPRSLSGGFFMDSDFIRVDEAPKGLKWYRYIDLAIGRNSKSDWNSCLAVAHDETTGLIYFRDMVRVRALEEFLKIIKGWMLDEGEKGTTWAVEDVAFQTVVFTDFMKDKDLLSVVIGQEKPEGDKLTRARGWQIRARQGFLRLVDGPWAQSFIDECKNFSASARHDDQVDTASGGYKMCGAKKFKAEGAVA